jgi:hypothetical protein
MKYLPGIGKRFLKAYISNLKVLLFLNYLFSDDTCYKSRWIIQQYTVYTVALGLP